LLVSFAMCTPLVCSDYYETSAPFPVFSGRRTYPTTWMDSWPWEWRGMVPVFTGNRSISLASSFAPAASPRVRRSSSS